MKALRGLNITLKNNPQNIILSIVLFLYSISFHSLIIGLAFFPLIMFIYLWRNKLQISLLSLFLIIFTILYAAFSYIYGFLSLFAAITFIFMPVSLYFTGEYVIKKEPRDKLTFFYVYLVIFSFFVFGILSIGKTVYYDGFSNLLLSTRSVYTPWNDIRFNATNIGAYFTMSLSLLGFIVSFQDKGRMMGIKMLSILIFVLSIISVLLLGNRTGVIIASISFMAVYFVYVFYGSKQNNKVTATIIIIITFLLIIYAIQSNILGVGEKLLGSTLVIRLSEGNLFEDIRFNAWQAAFSGLFEYPFGGKQAYIQLNYAHNLWLDVGYTAGIVPFIFFLIFSFLAFKHFVKLIKSKETPIELKTLLTGVYVSLFINFFVEPILEGYFVHFTMFCFIVGITSKYVRLTDKVTARRTKKRGVRINENTLVRQRSTS